MNQTQFIKRSRSILSDNNGARHVPHQLAGNALDITHLALADAGCKRIFAKVERRKYADYHFMLLCDVSGSMADNDRIETASDSVHALWHALRTAGATVSARFFNAETGPIPEAKLADADELFQFLRPKLKGDNGGCCNHDAYALEQAAKALLSTSKSAANVLLVLSDGQPACDGCPASVGGCETGGKYEDQHLALRQAIKRHRSARLQILAVDIESGAATCYYGARQSCYVSKTSELYPKACELLTRNLRRG
jgi:nitric oxide reductase activation protein